VLVNRHRGAAPVILVNRHHGAAPVILVNRHHGAAPVMLVNRHRGAAPVILQQGRFSSCEELAGEVFHLLITTLSYIPQPYIPFKPKRRTVKVVNHAEVLANPVGLIYKSTVKSCTKIPIMSSIQC